MVLLGPARGSKITRSKPERPPRRGRPTRTSRCQTVAIQIESTSAGHCRRANLPDHQRHVSPDNAPGADRDAPQVRAGAPATVAAGRQSSIPDPRRHGRRAATPVRGGGPSSWSRPISRAGGSLLGLGLLVRRLLRSGLLLGGRVLGGGVLLSGCVGVLGGLLG